MNYINDIPVDTLGVSFRTLNPLISGNILTVGELLKTPNSKLVMLRGFGQKAKAELDQALIDKGYIAITNTEEQAI